MSATKGKGIAEGRWRPEEIKRLRAIAHRGAAEAAKDLHRTTSSVLNKAWQEGISVRKKGEVRGRRAGSSSPQLRPSPWPPPGAELCPECARWPIEVEKVGLCRPCHLDRLADQHEREAEELEAAGERRKESDRRLSDPAPIPREVGKQGQTVTAAD